MTTDDHQLQTDIEQRLAATRPEVELLAVERVAAERLRLVIDHPDGVSLELCELVTKDLRDLLAKFALEVSSPGPERPLVKPEHFRRFIGRKARVRTREPMGRSADRSSGEERSPIADRASTGPEILGRAPDLALDGHRSFTGELVGASDEDVTVAAEGGLVTIPYTEISRSNLTQRGEG
ncbi:MAG: ribosome maturation factor RimP [Actinomycetota bacterium]